MRTLTASVLLTLAAVTLTAQSDTLPAAVRKAADAITAEQLAKDLAFLSSDELRGRNTPSPGFDTAARYIADRLQRAGLKPAGDDGTFFQHYEMHESRLDAQAASLEVNGRRLTSGEDFIVRSILPAMPRGAVPVVYVGHGWTVPDTNIDPFAGVDVKGKIVLAHGPRAMPKGVEIQQIGRISVGGTDVLAEAARRGAAAVVFIPLRGTAEGWDRMRNQGLVRRELEPSVPSAYAAAPSASILLSPKAAASLVEGETAFTGKDLIGLAESGDYPASFELKQRLTLDLPVSTTVHRPYNVVALLEGSDPVLRNEYITVASHLDGAVGTAAVDGDDIYNSADDNATGSAGNLRIAEQMVTVRPKRSLIFIWDSGEEQGLWGTRHFVANPPVPLDRIVAHVNIDMIGATRAPGSGDAESEGVTGPNEVYLIGPTVLSAGAGSLLDAVNGQYQNMRFNRSFDTPEHEFFYPRTDAGPFLERGILTIGFFTGVHPRYHRPADEARFLDPKKMEGVTRTAFVSIHALANAAERPRIDREIPRTVPRYR